MIFSVIIMIVTQASINQLVEPRTIDTIVERFIVNIICIITIMITIIIAIRFLASDFCSTIPDERCPEFLEAVLRQGLPALVGSSNPDEYPQVFSRKKNSSEILFRDLYQIIFFQFCNFVLPGTCPGKQSLLF